MHGTIFNRFDDLQAALIFGASLSLESLESQLDALEERQIFFGWYQVYTDLVPLASVQALVPQVANKSPFNTVLICDGQKFFEHTIWKVQQKKFPRELLPEKSWNLKSNETHERAANHSLLTRVQRASQIGCCGLYETKYFISSLTINTFKLLPNKLYNCLRVKFFSNKSNSSFGNPWIFAISRGLKYLSCNFFNDSASPSTALISYTSLPVSVMLLQNWRIMTLYCGCYYLLSQLKDAACAFDVSAVSFRKTTRPRWVGERNV